MKPATPLPWKALRDYYPEKATSDEFSPYIVAADGSNVAAAMMQPRERDFLANRAYIAHACNNYPKVVEALRGVLNSGARSSLERGYAILRELGESSCSRSLQQEEKP